MNKIKIKGATLHNLKNMDIEIPKNQLVVATGVSGSGKSSLMFDIVFEEGRKQYLKSLGILNDIESVEKFSTIEGLGPTIAVKQNIIRQSNPRSTVGSRTKVLSMLSMLLSTYGNIRCSSCDTIIEHGMICEACGEEMERLDLNYFSYNHPNGMCPTCSGRGYFYDFDLEALIPNETTTLGQVFDSVQLSSGFMRLVERRFGAYLAIPFWSLPEAVRLDVLYGHQVSNASDKVSFCLSRLFQSRMARDIEDTQGFYFKKHCEDCEGSRIGEDARAYLIEGKHIGELAQMTISHLLEVMKRYKATSALPYSGQKLTSEIIEKLEGMVEAKLGHLTLYREMPTLSGGEIQRLFLFNHLASKLDSLIYVLDEPTVGLHESEKIELMIAINHLKDIGNTVLVVEHDALVISQADHVIDIGPYAGVNGGEIMYQGSYDGLLKDEKSVTGLYLSGRMQLPSRQLKSREALLNSEKISIVDACTNNLKHITVQMPQNALVGICGVSGSGKSSLISQTLIERLKAHFKGMSTAKQSLLGMANVDNYCEISQAPIGRNINSTPASYTGIWDKIRKLFAEQPTAKAKDFNAGHFSFNSKGACEKCGGSGTETIWVGGDQKITSVCETCKGKRFNDASLTVLYHGKSIYDVLEMSIAEGIELFKSESSIVKILKQMDAIGMGYIKLGQPTSTLSGGEAQRIKLAKELSKKKSGHTLYILDEPTTGLSLFDTSKLILLLDQLVTEGNSVWVVEHDTHVLGACDWLVEIGPVGGENGGYVIAEGTPEDLKTNPNSKTGRYL
ncbi:ATP-binding cassette domain-containing protein [Fusibacter ferrireducens]|uniref:UvrABC system protein A n=1 Tax=Fusibacter ferrireducens TaxID=2785058 RepID=A0ABR9ZYQ4_9FIRM|nr:excinuclease ABC subunit UvrA [Fusibacter ferrireducens]MBF4695591.1 excinuclease ABC subunit UvrA [Fusibacter ferrireducens]